MEGGDICRVAPAGIRDPAYCLAAPVAAPGALKTDPHSSPLGNKCEGLAPRVTAKTHTFYLGREREKGWLWRTSLLPPEMTENMAQGIPARDIPGGTDSFQSQEDMLKEWVPGACLTGGGEEVERGGMDA